MEKTTETKAKNAQKEQENKVKTPDIVFSIVVLDNGSILVNENGKAITNLENVEFYADGKSAPKYTITRAIKRN